MKPRISLLVAAVECLALVFCLLIAVSRPAHAYLDPGSGSYALQLGVAGLFGAAFSIKLMWRRIAQVIIRCFGGSSDNRNSENS